MRRDARRRYQFLALCDEFNISSQQSVDEFRNFLLESTERRRARCGFHRDFIAVNDYIELEETRLDFFIRLDFVDEREWLLSSKLRSRYPYNFLIGSLRQAFLNTHVECISQLLELVRITGIKHRL